MENQELMFDITKDVQHQPAQQLLIGRVGDGGLKTVTIKVFSVNSNSPYDLTGLTPIFMGKKPNNQSIIDQSGGIVLDPQNGIFRFTFDQEVFTCEGLYVQAFFVLKRGDQVDSTLEFSIKVLPNKVVMGINSQSYLSEYNQLIQTLNQKTEQFIEEIKQKEQSYLEATKVLQTAVDNANTAIQLLEEKIKGADIVTKQELTQSTQPFKEAAYFATDGQEIV